MTLKDSHRNVVGRNSHMKMASAFSSMKDSGVLMEISKSQHQDDKKSEELEAKKRHK